MARDAQETGITYRDKFVRVFVSQLDPSRVEFTLELADSKINFNEVQLKFPFRRAISEPRLTLIVGELLDHDFLTTQKLQHGQHLSFEIVNPLPRTRGNLRVISSLMDDAAWNAKVSLRALPWLLPSVGMTKLFAYQKVGVEWLLEKPNRLLADDMGLGKTVQTIFGVRIGFREDLFGKVLILCPKSLVFNWLSEFQKWAPELLSIALGPPTKSAKPVWHRALKNSHVIISNYEQVREADKLIGDFEFDLIVADEAHRLRNAGSLIARGFKTIQRKRFWALSGTPIERDLKDLATLMSFLDPKRFSLSDARNASPVLRARARPYILRRTKSSVLEDLPEVITKCHKLELSKAQLKSYRKVQSGQLLAGGKIQNPLQELGELRKVCDYDPVSRVSSKLDAILDGLQLVCKANEKAIVFSYTLEPLSILAEMSSNLMSGVFISGKMSGDERSNVIERFKNDPTITVLFASSKVASEGLTLTEANHVFFVNRWWNPSSNAQARDRVNRIGQKKVVHVNEYLCVDTVEERIEQVLSEKGRLYDKVIGNLEELLLQDPSIRNSLKTKHN